MVIILQQLLLLSSVSAYNIGCQETSCSTCTPSTLYQFQSKSCLVSCPTGYSESSTRCYKSSSGQSLISTQFYQQLDFEASTVGDFETESSDAFSNPLRLNPIPTKERGFYFDTNSGLKSSKLNQYLAPDLTIRLLVRITGCDYGECTLLEIFKSLSYKKLLSLKVDSINLISTWTVVDSVSTVETPKVLTSNFEYSKWFKVVIFINQFQGFLKLGHALLDNYGNGEAEASYGSQEFRHSDTPAELTYYLGGIGQSFKGFLYELLIDNDIILTYDISAHLVDCDYNQYYSHPQCLDCDSSCSTWPWCVRKGSCTTQYKNLCFSPKCPSCTGYTPDHCTTSPTPTQVECYRFCLTCETSSPYKCLTCPSHLTPINSHCIYKPYNWDQGQDLPSVSLTFETFEQYYGGLFQSGYNSATYAPFHYPEDDDPIPMKSRGLYFTNTSKLKSISDISMYYENTFLIWAKPQGAGFNFWNSPSILLYSDAHSSLLLTDSETWTRFNSIEKKSGISGWNFYAFVHSYADYTFESKVYLNGNLLTKYNKKGYLLYDIRTTVWILGEGFLYSLNAYNMAKTGIFFEYSDGICGSGGYATCLWDCGQDEFLDEDDGVCKSCGDDCDFGCIEKSSCNLCLEKECLTCTSFSSSTCISMNSSNCAPGWPSYEEYNECCSTGCFDCDGPFDFSCTSCYSGYYLAGSQCLSMCPAGFEEKQGSCILKNALIADFIFDTIYDVYQSANYPITFATGQDSSFYPDHLPSDPIPAIKRGIYFKKTSYITSSNFTFAESVTIVMWIKFYQYGQILQKNFFSLRTDDKTYAQVSVGNIMETSLPILYTWTSLYIQAWSSSDHRINIQVGSIPMKFSKFLGSIEHLSDSDSSIIIGDAESSFIGFLYRIQIYNTKFDVSNLKEEKVCSITIKKNCVWDCELGYYWSGESCTMCNDRCDSGCKDLQHCNICADEICHNCHDYHSTCDMCKNHAMFYGDTCICNAGYYWNLPTESCEPCNPECKLCVKVDECLECVDDNCELCTTIYPKTCVQCLEGFEAVDGVCVQCTETQFYSSEDKTCEDCTLPCKTCPNLKTCTSCLDNAHFIDNNLCECDEGFELDSENRTCQQTYFSIKYSINNKNVIRMHFDESLGKDLKKSDLKVIVTTSSVSFNLKKISKSKWDVELDLADPATRESRVHLDVISKLLSEDGSLFVPEHYTALLFVQESLDTEGISDVTTVAQGALFTVWASILGSALVIMDPSSFFFFLQALELYVIVLIYIVNISPALKFCLQLLSLGAFIPNIFQILIPSNLGVSLHGKLKDFGYDTNLFLINSGVNLFTIIVLSILLPLFYALSKVPIKFVQEKASKMLKQYHFRVVSRCYVQMFLEFILSSFIGFKYIRFENPLQYFDFAICIFVVGLIVAGIYQFYKIIKRKISNLDDREVEEEWGTFFDDIRNSKQTQFFYAFYFVRRAVLGIVIAFMPSELMQLVVSAIFSMAIAVYVLNFKPFVKKRTNFYMAVSEFFLISFYLNLISGILSNGSLSIYTIGSAGIKIIICVLIFNAAYVIYELGQFIYDKLQKNRKARVLPSAAVSAANITSIVDHDDLFRNPSMQEKRSD